MSAVARWARDIWLLIITLIVLLTANQVVSLVHDIRDTRRANVAENCRNNTAQDDVLRAILVVSLEQARKRPPDPDRPPFRDQVRLVEQLMRPLGGLHLTEREKQIRCAAQISRFLSRPAG